LTRWIEGSLNILSPAHKLSFFVIMSKSVILSLLAQGNTGFEILQILDTLAADTVSDSEEADI